VIGVTAHRQVAQDRQLGGDHPDDQRFAAATRDNPPDIVTRVRHPRLAERPP
jgi:hypothetical protein